MVTVEKLKLLSQKYTEKKNLKETTRYGYD